MFNEIKLSNGIRVITKHMNGLRSFAIGVYVKACSNYEESDEIGISHLIEHMMFKGTKKYTAKQIAQVMDNIGGSMNAYTSKDCTAYYAKVLYEHADIAIDLLSEILIRSNFKEEDIAKEIKVVQEEIAMYEDSPEDVVYDLFSELVYKNHPLATPVLGYKKQISLMKRENILDYKKRYYSATNTIISVAGYLPDNLINQLEISFADYAINGDSKTIKAPVFHGGYKCSFKDIEQSHMCLGFEGVCYGHADHYAMLLLSNYLGGTSSSQLFQAVREDNGLVYGIYSHHTFFVNSGHLTIYLSYQPQNENLILPLIISVLNNLKTSFTPEILECAKDQLKGTYLLGMEGSGSIMASHGKRSIYGLKIQSMDDIIAAIDAISYQQVMSLIDKLQCSPFALTMVGQINNEHVKNVYEMFMRELRG